MAIGSPILGKEFRAASEMVCSRGESPTTHMNQMKLFKAIAATAVVGAFSTMISMPANSEVHANLDTGKVSGVNNGRCVYYVTKNGVTKSLSLQSGSMECNPWTAFGPGHFESIQMWGSVRHEAQQNWNRL